MTVQIWMGHGRQMLPVPREEWEKHLAAVPQHREQRLGFMSEDHQRVRYYSVKELARRGEPLPPELIARECQLPLERVKTILDELERHLVFVVRNDLGAVSWAFPVTVEPTPHRLTFNTGERLYGA